MKQFILIVIAALSFSLQLTAKVEPAPICTDGMVLQKESKVFLWGKAEPNSIVQITPSWNYKDIISAQANAQGNWIARIKTPKASFTPYTLTLNDGTNPTVIRNILIGEVWLASGQSNMSMSVEGWKNCPIDNSDQIITGSGKYSGKLHFANIPNKSEREPQSIVMTHWKDSKPDQIKGFSCVAYYFAAALIDKLNCPVGIINCQWGGSRVEAWLPKEILQTYKGVDLSEKAYEKMNYITPTALYNGMINPLKGYTLAGFIWYQGEANVSYERDEYAKHFTDMITRWRQDWNNTKLPFYFVEIAPYMYEDNKDGISSALLREQQCKASHLLNNIGMVGTNDLVKPSEEKQIHPANKQPVGQRLANWALHDVYNQTALVTKSPEFKSMSIKNGRVFLNFSNTKNGFNRTEGIQGFEICGSDSLFLPATAIVRDGKVMLKNDKISNPTAVRYCFHNWQIGNLASKEGLPVIPFRTNQ